MKKLNSVLRWHKYNDSLGDDGYYDRGLFGRKVKLGLILFRYVI